MSIGDAIRRLVDPLDPRVAAWLRVELPRLVAAGVIRPEQADAIAQRYGLAPTSGAVAAPAVEPGAESVASQPEPTSAPQATSTPTPAASVPAAAPVQRAPSPFLAEQAVSIVLYLGAFLVVTAVAIFLAYSWGDIGGTTKLCLLMLLTAGFLGAAALCLRFASVRPAGHTFLAIGALLVPANVAAAYFLVFSETSVPPAVFWLLGALLSGGLHASLSVRLGSRAYGVLAILAVPVAADALTWLVVPNPGWLWPPAAVALLATIAAGRRWPATRLAQAARVVGAALLPVTVLVALPTVGDDGSTALAAPIALLLSSLGLAWEATRRAQTWWFGAAANLLLLPFVALALADVGDRPLFVASVIAASWIATATARRLDRQRAVLWDAAAIIPSLIYAIAAWESDGACAALLVSSALLAVVQTYAWRLPLPLYAGVLAADGLFVKLLAIYGSPDSPAWTLGATLWPLGIAWAVLACVLSRRLAGPFLFGAFLTLVVAALLVTGQQDWQAGIALSAAAATIAAAWRLRLGWVVLLAVPWLVLGVFTATARLDVTLAYRLAATGLGGWLLLAVSTRRPPPLPSTEPPPPLEPEPTAPAPATPPARPPRQKPLDLDWGLAGRIGAVALAGLAALMVTFSFGSGDRWLEAVALGWLDLALMLAASARLARSRDVAVLAALALVPAMIAGIARLHLDEPQAYALPIGFYLLGIAAVERRDRRPGRAYLHDAIATLGLLVLLGISVIQSLDDNRFRYVTLALLESLVVGGVGIGVRWRALVVGGVAGVVVVAVRQLFDALSALPGWAILGGTGLLLLGLAVVLLLARARLATAGRAAAERWSSWG